MFRSNLNQLFERQPTINLMLLPILPPILRHPNGIVFLCESGGKRCLARRWSAQENYMRYQVAINPRMQILATGKSIFSDFCTRNGYSLAVIIHNSIDSFQ